MRCGEYIAKFNILVCDDDEDIVTAIDIYLSNEGYNILKAYNGIEALATVNREEVHLIIMDVMMSELDGIRTTVKIRQEIVQETQREAD